jgi:hypothetical protein
MLGLYFINKWKKEQVFSIKISTTNVITPYTSCFKLQCNMWRQFVHQRPETCRKIITTCVILHNLIRLRYPATHNLMDLRGPESECHPRGISIKISTTNVITPYTSCFKLQCNMWRQFVHHHNVSVSVFILLSLEDKEHWNPGGEIN